MLSGRTRRSSTALRDPGDTGNPCLFDISRVGRGIRLDIQASLADRRVAYG